MISIKCNNIGQLDQILKGDNKLVDLPDKLKDALVSIIKKERYINCTIRKKTVSTNGKNFLGILHEVDVKGTTHKGDKETHLFIKQAIVVKKIRVVSIPHIYSKEAFFYTELATILDNLQDEVNVPEKERLNIAKGYKESCEKGIILENLARKGYKTFNRLNGLSIKCAELSVEQLAKLHGIFLVMQKRMPDYYEQKIKTQKYPLTFEDDWNGFITNICNKAVEVLDGSLKERVKTLLPKLKDVYEKYLRDNSSVCVLCHGDYKTHNIMIKEVDGETVDVIPLDYQLMYHGCPVTDLMFYIFSGTDQEFRRTHLEHLKGLYYDTLGRYLGYFGMDIETIFPRKLFEQMYTERLPYGLMTGTIMSYFFFIPEDDVPDMENQALAEVTINPDHGFESWVRGLIDDFVQWGYI